MSPASSPADISWNVFDNAEIFMLEQSLLYKTEANLIKLSKGQGHSSNLDVPPLERKAHKKKQY